MKNFHLPLGAFLILGMIGCLEEEEDEKRKPMIYPSKSVHHVSWDYAGSGSPEHWAELSEEFIQCAEGHFQSPIDISTMDAIEHPGSVLSFQYHPSPVDVVNDGHTVQAILEASNILTANQHDYELKQIHFHVPSEHQVDGIVYPMEMHMVHADSNSKLAVVGVFIKEGKENQYLKTFWQTLPEQIEKHVHPEGKCDVSHLLPEEHTVFHYQGSLTTPPCSEGVEWFVMKEPVTLSKQQIKQFKELYPQNNRPVQEHHAALIEVVKNK
jgi:carbonic anhydrase